MDTYIRLFVSEPEKALPIVQPLLTKLGTIGDERIDFSNASPEKKSPNKRKRQSLRQRSPKEKKVVAEPVQLDEEDGDNDSLGNVSEGSEI